MKCGNCICVQCEEEFGIDKGECMCYRCKSDFSGDGIGYCKKYWHISNESQITFLEGLDGGTGEVRD